MEVLSISKDYASGIKRLLAFFIDRLLLHAVFSVIFFRWWGAPFGWDWDHLNFGIIHLGLRFWEYNMVIEALIVLYFSYMESSKYQATGNFSIVAGKSSFLYIGKHSILNECR